MYGKLMMTRLITTQPDNPIRLKRIEKEYNDIIDHKELVRFYFEQGWNEWYRKERDKASGEWQKEFLLKLYAIELSYEFKNQHCTHADRFKKDHHILSETGVGKIVNCLFSITSSERGISRELKHGNDNSLKTVSFVCLGKSIRSQLTGRLAPESRVNQTIMNYSGYGQADDIEQAINDYQQALQIRTQQTMPVERTTSMMDLRNTDLDLIGCESADNLEQATYSRPLKHLSLLIGVGGGKRARYLSALKGDSPYHENLWYPQRELSKSYHHSITYLNTAYHHHTIHGYNDIIMSNLRINYQSSVFWRSVGHQDLIFMWHRVPSTSYITDNQTTIRKRLAISTTIPNRTQSRRALKRASLLCQSSNKDQLSRRKGIIYKEIPKQVGWGIAPISIQYQSNLEPCVGKAIPATLSGHNITKGDDTHFNHTNISRLEAIAIGTTLPLFTHNIGRSPFKGGRAMGNQRKKTFLTESVEPRKDEWSWLADEEYDQGIGNGPPDITGELSELNTPTSKEEFTDWDDMFLQLEDLIGAEDSPGENSNDHSDDSSEITVTPLSEMVFDRCNDAVEAQRSKQIEETTKILQEIGELVHAWRLQNGQYRSVLAKELGMQSDGLLCLEMGIATPEDMTESQLQGLVAKLTMSKQGKRLQKVVQHYLAVIADSIK